MDASSASVQNEGVVGDIKVCITDEDLLMNATVKQEPAEESEGDVGHAVTYGDIEITYEPDIKTEFEISDVENCSERRLADNLKVEDCCLMNGNVKQELTEEESDVGHANSYGSIDVHEPEIKAECERASRESHLRPVASTSSQCDDIVIRSTKVPTNELKEKPTCNICTKTFSNVSNLRAHKRIHTGEKPFMCNICTKTFSQLSHLNEHRRIHTGEKPFKCNICMKTFCNLSNLTEHERIHSGKKPFECNICMKTFRHSSNLMTHKRIHTGEKPFKCNICIKTFSRASHLKLHKLTHTGEKPFKCNVCMKTFTRLDHLTSHKGIHTDEKPFECDICMKTFSQSSALTTHKRFHTGDKPECNICMKTFSSGSCLRRHKRIHTGAV